MEIKQIEVYSELSNFGIVRMPDRHFPGAVIQGDSLHILCRHARWIVERAEKGGDPDLIGEAKELLELLQDRLSHYEKVLADHRIPLPYAKRDVRPNTD